MKIALAQLNPTIGDFDGNVEKIITAAHKAHRRNAELVVFSELVVCGYPPQDLLQKPSFIKACIDANARLLKELPHEITSIIGSVVPNNLHTGRGLMNVALVFSGGSLISQHVKTLLPTYDVFDEDRYFEPATIRSTSTMGKHTLGVVICEDIWANEQPDTPSSSVKNSSSDGKINNTGQNVAERHLYRGDPVDDLAEQGADLFISINASPFAPGKEKIRKKNICQEAARRKSPFIYVNAVGGHDELIFDGHSFAADAEGNIVACAGAFTEDLVFWDTETGTGDIRQVPASTAEETTAALVLGLHDYAHRCGFTKAVLGLSGGIDSAVTAAVAVRALGPENVLGITMPSGFSSTGSVDDSVSLAERLDMPITTIPISSMMEAFDASLSELMASTEPDVTEENIQARIRGTLVMAASNKFGYLPLATGNKSELAMGYCTLYGDMCGGIAVIGDVLKTDVYAIAQFINAEAEIIPWNTIRKPPSAELRPNQLDTDSLPDYEVLDPVLRAYVEERQSVEDIIASGVPRELVFRITRKVDLCEFKRKQAAPVLRVSRKAFGPGRRMPTAQKFIGS